MEAMVQVPVHNPHHSSTGFYLPYDSTKNTTFQILFMVLMGVWGRYQNDVLPGGQEDYKTINAQYPSMFSIFVSEKLIIVFQDIHVMIFAGFGFLMTFLKVCFCTSYQKV